MRNLYLLATIRGMPVRLHYTWIILVVLGVAVLSGVTLPSFLPASGSLTRLILSIVILALCFGTVVAHELAHLLVARRFGVRFPVLNLYPLGALTRLPDRRAAPKDAFWTAAAGPAVSLALWWGCNYLGTAAVIPWYWLAVVLFVVGQFNLYLGLINLLPGLPLDGGRMLRAALWYINALFESAHRIAILIGQAIAYGMIVIGASAIAGQQHWLWGVALVLIGWAIREAGGVGHRRELVAGLLHRLTAAEVLRAPTRQAAPEQTLRELALSLRGRTGRALTPVIANEMFLGMIDRERALEVPQGHWDERTVADTMIPAAELAVVAPDTPVSALIPRLAGADAQQQQAVPVVEAGRLIGLIDADQLVEILDLEAEFGLFPRRADTATVTQAQPEPVAAAEPDSVSLERVVGR